MLKKGYYIHYKKESNHIVIMNEKYDNVMEFNIFGVTLQEDADFLCIANAIAGTHGLTCIATDKAKDKNLCFELI